VQLKVFFLMIQTILFAADMGLHTSYLLHHVNELAAQHKARIIVLHVIEPASHMSDAVLETYMPTEAKEQLREEGVSLIADAIKARIVDTLEEEFIDGQDGLSQIRDVNVITGKPVDVILQQADEYRADMIILGSHGETVAGPNMLGSVTAKILQMSRIPVYMVPLIRSVMPHAQAS
jgi:nucleotide-binding universal stress UspA family protein